jgi:hypothetical protein
MIIYNNFPREESALVEPSRTVTPCGSCNFHVVRFVLESKHQNIGNGSRALHFLYVAV